MIQSISDIITNSSSEVFIIDSDNNEKIISFIQDACEHFGYDMSDIMTVDIADKDDNFVWFNKAYPYKKGNLVIESTYDNSIPGLIWDLINNLSWYQPPVIEDIDIKDVTRIHLG
jgi:hypothetical protein